MKKCMMMAGLALVAAAGAAEAAQVRVWGDMNDGNRLGGENAQFRTGNGGEFKVQVISGFAGVTNAYSDNIGQTVGGTTFQSFCMERDEYIWNPGNTYGFDQPLTDTAQLGGNNTNGGDQISLQTAWLYTQFRTGALSNYDYTSGAGREGSADQLQHAVWVLEQEFNNADVGQAAVVARLNSLGKTQAVTWVNAAFAATNAGWGANGHNVRALNIFVDSNNNGNHDQGETYAQSQLTLIPLPTGAGLAMAGMGILAIRRRTAR